MSGIPDVGVVFDTNISLSADKIDINLGETVCFKGVLYAYYQSVSSGNLDFCNTLDNVTLKGYTVDSGNREQIGTVVTDSNGEFVFDFTPDTEGTYNLLFICEDTSNYNGCESSLFNINVGSLHVGLSVSSTSINFGEEVTLTATVLDSETPVSGASVTFYDGSSVLGTGNTNSSGVATYVTNTLSVGSHSLTASNGSVVSSPVYVNVDKLIPTISISAPSTGTVGSAFVVSGTLSCTGSVKLYENGSLLGTLTVSGGAFSETLTKSVTGSYSYYVVFDGDSTYEAVTSSTVTVTVSAIAPSYDDIVLTADDSILSYYDGDTTTLRAQLMDGSSTASVSGVTVEFFNGSTSLGTSQTDSNGVAVKTYTSTGAGDVSLKAEADNGTLVTETFVIYDYWKYDSSVHSTEAEVINWDLPTGDFEITAYIERATGGAFIQIGDGTTSNRVLFGHASSTNDCYLYSGSNYQTNGSGNNTDHTLEIINGVAYYTVNGNTISLTAPTGLTHKLYQFAPWGNSKISNIRIKPL